MKRTGGASRGRWTAAGFEGRAGDRGQIGRAVVADRIGDVLPLMKAGYVRLPQRLG